MSKSIKRWVLLSLLATALAFWGPHACEKVAIYRAGPAKPPAIGSDGQKQTVARVLVALAVMEGSVGTRILKLPELEGAITYDALKPETQQAYLKCAWRVIALFGLAELALVVFFLGSGFVALRWGEDAGLRALFKTYSLALLLSGLMLAGHILAGLRPNLASQMGFLALSLLGQVVLLAVMRIGPDRAAADRVGPGGGSDAKVVLRKIA